VAWGAHPGVIVVGSFSPSGFVDDLTSLSEQFGVLVNLAVVYQHHTLHHRASPP
jgi:hypothetical protein